MLWNCKLDTKYQEKKSRGLVKSSSPEPEDGWVHLKEGCVLIESVLKELIECWEDLVLETLTDTIMKKLLKKFCTQIKASYPSLDEPLQILETENMGDIAAFMAPIFDEMMLNENDLEVKNSLYYFQLALEKPSLITSLLYPYKPTN